MQHTETTFKVRSGAITMHPDTPLVDCDKGGKLEHPEKTKKKTKKQIESGEIDQNSTHRRSQIGGEGYFQMGTCY